MPQFKRGEQRHQVLIKKLRSDFTGFSLLPKIIQFKRLTVIEIYTDHFANKLIYQSRNIIQPTLNRGEIVLFHLC